MDEIELVAIIYKY